MIETKYKFVVSSVITSVLFALAHKTLYHLLPTFMFSMYSCYVYKKTGDLKISMLMHIFYNILSIFVGMLTFNFDLVIAIMSFIVSIVVTIGLFFNLNRLKVEMNLK